MCSGLGPILNVDVPTLPRGCDCLGNQEDALGVCGGSCEADAVADGICDAVDACVGLWTPVAGAMVGDVYECGCSEVPEGDCDCDGNQLDALGVCGGLWRTSMRWFATISTSALARLTNAGCAMAKAPSTNVDVETFLRATAIAMATS